MAEETSGPWWFVDALREANLLSFLEAPVGPFTVFAPSADALEALPDFFLEAFFSDSDENVEWIKQVLLYHMAIPTMPSSRVMNGMEIGTLSVGNTLFLSKDGNGTLTINGGEAMTEVTDITATNGVIHIIDSLLIPETIRVEFPELFAVEANAASGTPP
ncbi:MAG: fasciclin domain-containing protein [Clostridia bacterium]|nr:fasciclin domain-containing protein [Clostridia bacterium]